MVDGVDGEELTLTEDQAIEEAAPGFEDEVDGNAEPEGESVIAFADEADEPEAETPLVKRLREQLRQAQRAARRPAAAVADDPEPTVRALKSIEEFDFDTARHEAYLRERDAEMEAKAEWKVRQADRERAHKAAQDEQVRRVEQQKRALGVPSADFDAKADLVKDRLSEAQLAIVLNGADDPAKVIYALGRSPARLDMLAGEENLAKFAVTLGKMEKDIKVVKRTAPPPVSRVTGATAPIAAGSDKELERLEKEAERTGDRSKIIAYRRSLRAA